MSEISWRKESPNVDNCEMKGYLLKRKMIGGKVVYEIWKDGTMHYDALPFQHFSQLAKKIIQEGVL